MTRSGGFGAGSGLGADVFGTLGSALWIGGAQWAGKSTVTRVLAARYGLTAYHHDYPAIRSHLDRQAAARARAGFPYIEPTAPDWMGSTPDALAQDCLTGFAERLEYVFDDLRALVSPRPVLAEGFGLRPEALVPACVEPGRMVVMVPTEEFRRYQARTLERARAVSAVVSDPALAQERRLERDRLLGEDAVRAARERGVRVLEVDGSLDAEAVADVVAGWFAAYLPPLLAKAS
jgi:2-phosphoglycerate kinase